MAAAKAPAAGAAGDDDGAGYRWESGYEKTWLGFCIFIFNILHSDSIHKLKHISIT